VERDQPVFTLLDAGVAMSYSIRGYKKIDYAINAALILADIVNLSGDKSGLLIFDSNVKTVIAPGKGDTHRNRLMEAVYHLESSKNASDYEGAFRELINRQKRRGLVFIFTDFETPEQARELAANAQLLKRRYTPIIVLMKNVSLQKLMNEPGGSLENVYQKAVAHEFLEQRRAVIRDLNAHGVYCVESDADKFALTAVNRYLEAKR
jgi:uncharacterized protein (DUF58 family)